MVTPISIEPIEVRQVMPVDVTGVRDPGMRALVLLAASLGWNVIQKVNNPIALVARDGMQRRLPTNTSIRMSVFQTALSSIIVHSEDRIATPELIDAIVEATKIDRDHERRLRIAIGETAEEHRQRLANERAAEQKRQPDEHLTQTITVPEPEPEPDLEFDEETALVSFEPPQDGRNHGGLMSRKPFIAHHQVTKTGTNFYESDSSLERVWQDGYKDYECPTCGRVFRSPKGAGAHRQVHTKSGEVEAGKPAWMRARVRGNEQGWRVVKRRRTRKEMAEQVPPPVEAIVFEEPPPEHVVQTSVGPRGTGYIDEDAPFASTPGFGVEDDEFGELVAGDVNPEAIIDRIASLVAPRIMASRDMWKRVAEDHAAVIESLQADLGAKSNELDKLRADWDALRGLIDGR
jgi:hypothetical protein